MEVVAEVKGTEAVVEGMREVELLCQLCGALEPLSPDS